MIGKARWTRYSVLLLLSVVGCGGEPSDGYGESSEGVGTTSAELTTAVDAPPSFELTNVWYVDGASGRVKFLPRAAGKFLWQEVYDVHPTFFHLVWTSKGVLSASDLPKLLAGQGFSLSLRVGSETLFRGPNGQTGDYSASLSNDAFTGCAAGKQCLLTSINGSKAATLPATWDLSLSYLSITPGLPSNTSQATVLGFINKKSLFVDKIEPIFRSERCTTCHSFGTPQALYQHHDDELGMSGISGLGKLVATDHGTRLECAGSCHDVTRPVAGRSFAETTWMVPMSDMNIDWRFKNARQICETVKQHLPSIQKMNDHFFEDGRIAWAVNDAKAPFGIQLSKAQPGNYADFEDAMRAWIHGGLPCPK